MSIGLLRVDERLIHGQVTVGWGARMEPARYVVIDDRLANSEWEKDLIALGAPSGSIAQFVTVQAAREEFARWREMDEVVVLLTRDLEHMVRLARGGRLRGIEVNLGGIHHASGRHEVLPYLYLDADDRERIRELGREGALVSARDLPASPRTGLAELLE